MKKSEGGKKKKKKTWIGSVTLPSASGCFWWTETSSSVSDWFLSICVPQLCVSCLPRADTHLAQAPPTSFLCEHSSTKGCPSAHCHGSSISIRLEPPWHVLALRLLFRCIVQQLLLIGRLLCKAISLFGLVCHSVWDRSSVCCFYWAVMSFFLPAKSCERTAFVTRQWALVSSVQCLDCWKALVVYLDCML